MNGAQPYRLDGSRVLITGASRGIGAAIAVACAGAGARVALAARTHEATAGTAARICELGGSGDSAARPEQLAGDLSDPETAPRIVREAALALGGLDVLVLNAGVLPLDADGRPVFTPLTVSEIEDWEPVLAVNLTATVALCRAAHPLLVESAAPSVLVVSSVAGLIGVPTMEAYGVTKAAQLSLVRSLATAWAAAGIRVNALCPGWVRTDMTQDVHANAALSDLLMRHVPLARWAGPEEVAAPAVFLASPAASFITGHALVIDGGLTVPHGGLADVPAPQAMAAAAASSGGAT